MMQSILITGGAGFIGSHFVHLMAHKYPEARLIVLDSLTYAASPQSIRQILDHPKRTLIKGNILDRDLLASVLRAHAIDTVVHFAAESHVDQSIASPDVFLKTNIEGTHNLLHACMTYWVQEKACEHHRFLHVSTDEVYGELGPEDPPFTENTPYAPNSPYSASKAASDHWVRAYHRTYGLKTLTTHCSNNFGPWQHHEKLLPTIIRQLAQGQPITLYGDGQNVRDWLYVGDHCAALERVLRLGTCGEVYNIGGHQEWTNLALIQHVCDHFDSWLLDHAEWAACFPNSVFVKEGHSSRESITLVPDRPGHDRRYAVATEKLDALASSTPTPFDEALKTTLHWYVAQWIEETYPDSPSLKDTHDPRLDEAREAAVEPLANTEPLI